ncbi:MAG: right-handed parallel beta-helix repeat-containing protein [Betaproteobacteria bacterium]
MKISDKLLRASLLILLALAIQPLAGATEYFVSLAGKDANPGTPVDKAFRTIAKGISVLKAGDILSLRHGVYVEPVNIAGKVGPIVIRSYPGEHAYIDGSLAQFRKKNNSDWMRAVLVDPAAHPEEYISVGTFNQDFVNRGAFLDRNPYTRLITYSKIEDLRAPNQTFDKIGAADARPGPAVFLECPADDPDQACETYPGQDHRFKPAGYRHPWVYMGPGIWFDNTNGKIHIRLSRTTNSISGLADYTGDVDPGLVALAISPKDLITLNVRGSSNLRFENLSVRYGGQYTVHMKNNFNVAFDHVRIFAGSYGMRAQSNAIVLRNCEVNGGLPTWYFRSDRKAEYFYRDAGGNIVANNLGGQTLIALLLGNPNDVNTEIANCEFKNAHDLYLVGRNLRFHHNWINNLNDEGLFLDSAENPDLRVFQNVITKTLSPISFAGGKVAGPLFIYRNLIDVRGPSAGYRPRSTGDTDIWRYGNTFKSNEVDGPYALFHNTFLVYAQGGQASYLHFRSLVGDGLRRSFNNIFVAVNPDAESDRPITFLPSPCFPGPTDGNNYYRIGAATTPAYRYLEYSCGGLSAKAGTFSTLPELWASGLFQQSKSQYAPGYEANSIETNPKFKLIGADGKFRITDDLRLREGSPATATGVVLPSDLNGMDPLRVESGRPDIGAYPLGSAPLRVGVDGRISYPGASEDQ